MMLKATHRLNGIRKRSLLKFRVAGDIAQRERNWTKAIENYGRFLKDCPDDAAIWVQMGHAYKELIRFDEAEGAYREALRAKPGDGDAVLHLSAMLYSLGREQDAVALAPTLVREGAPFQVSDFIGAKQTEVVADPAEISNSQRGDLARGIKDWPSAAVFYSLHLQEYPHDGGIWTQLGHMLKEQSLLDEALFAYQVAKRFESNSSDVSLHLAALLMRLGRTVDATPMWSDMFSNNKTFFLRDR